MSLRTRLLVAVGLVAILALAAADVATYSSLRSFLLDRVDQGLQASHEPIERILDGGGANGGAPSGPGSAPPAQGDTGNGDLQLLQVANNTFVEVRSAGGTVIKTQPAFERGGAQEQPRLPARVTGLSPAIGPQGEPAKYFDAPSATTGGPSFRVRASELANGNYLFLAVPLSDTLSTLHRLLFVELAVTGGAIVLAGLAGWWLVRVGMRPLLDIERTAEAIARGELGQRVPVGSPRTEVGRLGGALNAMLGRIEDAFAARDATERELRRSEGRLRRFVADASHELRTPVAAVSAYAELFERGADRRPEDLTRVMSGIRNETERMGHLVDDLLILARVDEGRPFDRAPVELVGLSAESVEAANTVGPQWPVRLEASQPVEVTGDRARLRQVLDNLLSNVRSHTPPGTTAVVRVARQDGQAVVTVEDNGPGVKDGEYEKLFERFYRSDASRSRTSGGSGLGLSIVAAITSAHDGTAVAGPGPGKGTTFTITFPLDGEDPAEQ